MTKAELVRLLRKYPDDAKVRVSVSDADDTAFTDEVADLVENATADGPTVTIRGWVRSENEGACAPWSCK